MDITPYIGPAFRLLRESIDLSQEELAFRAGLDRTYVSGIERGRRNPSLKSMQRLAAELSQSLDQVFILARELAEKMDDAPVQRRVKKRTSGG
ncbi:helix-turn-helix transcriptional regulator [Rhodanobacter sp. A1T4]|uniref:helix-turn-helix domain-containing protein n=1 Tax=Rhodanobacter sp. A1T4 TaxID=2723087 RepID=UPI00161A148D